MIPEGDIYIRDVLPKDVPIVLKWENDPANWEVSERDEPYTLQEIVALLASSENYSETQQKRWIIALQSNDQPIGAVDVFQGDLPTSETSIGILIADEENRRQGYAKQAIRLAAEKCFSELKIKRIHALVHAANSGSIHLFEKSGFERVASNEDYSNFEQGNLPIIKFTLCLKK